MKIRKNQFLKFFELITSKIKFFFANLKTYFFSHAYTSHTYEVHASNKARVYKQGFMILSGSSIFTIF